MLFSSIFPHATDTLKIPETPM